MRIFRDRNQKFKFYNNHQRNQNEFQKNNYYNQLKIVSISEKRSIF